MNQTPELILDDGPRLLVPRLSSQTLMIVGSSSSHESTKTLSSPNNFKISSVFDWVIGLVSLSRSSRCPFRSTMRRRCVRKLKFNPYSKELERKTAQVTLGSCMQLPFASMKAPPNGEKFSLTSEALSPWPKIVLH